VGEVHRQCAFEQSPKCRLAPGNIRERRLGHGDDVTSGISFEHECVHHACRHDEQCRRRERM
jgi:hypothetical protein